jgi:hypothetical protein
MEHCMARKVTVITLSKVTAIASKLGLNIKTGKNETKIFGESIKQSIAIPNTKGGATRIYPVGFEPTEGTVAHPKPPAKTVTVMFDHNLDEKLILRAIYKAAKSLKMKAAPAPAPTVEVPVEVTEVEVEQAPEMEQAAG